MLSPLLVHIMRYLLILVLLALFGYSLALVLLNGTESSVDLVFAQIPAMRLGLLLLLTLMLGIVVGILLSLQMFRVLPNQWELKRLRKEIEVLKQAQLEDVATKALNYAREHEYLKMDNHQTVSELKSEPKKEATVTPPSNPPQSSS